MGILRQNGRPYRVWAPKLDFGKKILQKNKVLRVPNSPILKE